MGDTKKYGLPLYCASWVPKQLIKEKLQGEAVSELLSTSTVQYLVLGGGGGQGHSGIKNGILITRFNFSSGSLDDEPVNKFIINDDIPYRKAIHPGGEGLIASLPSYCRRLEWDVPEDVEPQELALKSSASKITQLEDVGQQLALAFNADGSLLATGGEDGCLRIFKWPSMEKILDQADSSAPVKDLDFSQLGKLLASVEDNGRLCRVWDLNSFKVVSTLSRENGDVFRFCRFSKGSKDNQILYTASMQGQQGCIVSWDTTSWKRIGSKKFVRDQISAFDISANGELLAIGTVEGMLVIIDAASMQVKMTVKKAHLGFTTALAFSHDSRALASTSMDSSVRVTVIKDKEQNGSSVGVIFFVVLLAILAYVLKENGLPSDIFKEWKH